MKVKITVPRAKEDRFKPPWAKIVTGVDRSKTNGYAFEGKFLRRGLLAEVPVGSIILIYDVVGTWKHHKPEVDVYQVTETGDLKLVLSDEGWDWALSIRDDVADLLDAQKQATNDEQQVSSSLIIAGRQTVVKDGITLAVFDDGPGFLARFRLSDVPPDERRGFAVILREEAEKLKAMANVYTTIAKQVEDYVDDSYHSPPPEDIGGRSV